MPLGLSWRERLHKQHPNRSSGSCECSHREGEERAGRQGMGMGMERWKYTAHYSRAEGQSHRRGGHLTRSLSKTRKNKNKGGENTVCNIILPADVCLNFSLFFFLHFQGLKRRPMVANLLLWRMGGLWAPGMKDSGRMAERLSTSSAKSIHRQTNREIKIK